MFIRPALMKDAIIGKLLKIIEVEYEPGPIFYWQLGSFHELAALF
jgi:hypothetical protein